MTAVCSVPPQPAGPGTHVTPKYPALARDHDAERPLPAMIMTLVLNRKSRACKATPGKLAGDCYIASRAAARGMIMGFGAVGVPVLAPAGSPAGIPVTVRGWQLKSEVPARRIGNWLTIAWAAELGQPTRSSLLRKTGHQENTNGSCATQSGWNALFRRRLRPADQTNPGSAGISQKLAAAEESRMITRSRIAGSYSRGMTV
jgi:hypothetical protein